MKSDRRRGVWDRRLPAADVALRESVLRVTAKDRRTFGFLLSRLRDERRLTFVEQAVALGVSAEALVFVSVFRVRRDADGEEDLAAAATAVGIEVGVLRGLLRDGWKEGAAAPVGGAA